MPRGTWTCKNGVLIPDQITTSSFSTSPTVECYSTISEIGSTCNSVTTTSSAQSPAVSASLPKVVYEGSYSAYYGDGSAAQGWPNIDGWIDFEKMFEINHEAMQSSCANWGVPNNSEEEMTDLKAAIVTIGQRSSIDPRFILAIIMQESTGCVRVVSTMGVHPNPGLMQSHQGSGTCNSNSVVNGSLGFQSQGVQVPCPYSSIFQMVSDGSEGTPAGDGLAQVLQEQGHADVSKYYRAARIYNSGRIMPRRTMAEVHTQIERHFKGFARVRLDHITFDSGRELDDRNVERLLGIFKLQGCQREEPGHSIPVLVDKDTLAAALAHEGSPPRILHQTSVEAEPLLFPSAITLTSLHGKHRVHAARKFLLPVDQWWTVKVFDTGLPLCAREHLRYEYSNAQKFSDGDIFRYYVDAVNRQDRRSASSWLAALTKRKRRSVKELQKYADGKFFAALKELLPLAGLWDGFLLGDIVFSFWGKDRGLNSSLGHYLNFHFL
ncbi:unnamed protein product [Zymoseptoria tritici ST99CH_1A5]|uniref:Uncharacterized protein n=1 Tax=Zymoseptoria tritici ST99CH_1A5 TaxID=1276529 RepID=A0A1Y6M094_ZYMTR|nr:unnamed protein product [Zymoseptoria tritici ST99CH_1A5]